MAACHSTPRLCSVEDCTNPHFGRGWCVAHYTRWKRHGDPMHGGPVGHRSIEERFWSKVYFPPCEGDCWTWAAHRNKLGYGLLWGGSSAVYAHRVAYELVIGSIPSGLVIDHLCRNHACVNPSHLEPVTLAENTRRGVGVSVVSASKTHCPQGHPYDDDNTLREHDGRRRCKTCIRAKGRLYYQTKRERNER